jgi:hypothetical protein
MFNAAKDAIAGRAVQAWANNLFARYGRVQDLTIDSARRTVEATCLLNGETMPFSLRIDGYQVEAEGDRKFIRATGFSCTRPWLQNLLTDFGHQQRIEVPAWAAAAL